MTCEIPHVYQMADEFRKRGKTVVIGGYHATAFPEEAAKHADIVVLGEAEGLWPQILLELEDGGDTIKEGLTVHWVIGHPHPRPSR
jgi:radical SAM superfamily enzyme YgiQ (UPF0313 family)